ncbi:MAG: twin-arginine translocase TatA/TatE family subunit [Elusimicrobiota bacterium]|jgi:sec-independent protein translocase protein TatA|nr:twin-arginine translocase TatA/TatE family subunit [Elusimicrobiota bacterium]
MSLGVWEIVLIILAVLLLFGAKRIPEIAKAFGRASHEFKKAKEEIEKETKGLTAAGEAAPAAQDKAEEKK